MKLDKAQLLLDEQPISIDVSAREIRQGRRAVGRRSTPPCRARSSAGRKTRAASHVGTALLRSDGRRLHSGRSRQLGSGHRHRRDVDQLFRAAGRRCDQRCRRRCALDLSGAESGGGNHAARRWRRLRLLADSAKERPRARHAFARKRADLLHARVRQELRDPGIRGCAARRTDGRAAL